MTLDVLIDRFENGGPLLAYSITNLSREHELARPGPGAWSVAELVVHMLDSDLVGADRIKRVIAEDSPTLLAYDENAWLARLGYEDLPVEEAVSMFLANRRWVSRILRSLPEADFSRAGDHTEKGRVTLAELVRGYVGHLDHHLKFLYAKRGNLGMAVYPRYSYALE
ncbi:DinB family protein [Tautonia plasticadhaerens]|uniref:Metal-dependent hydrolase YfiT n=1 Tax=Tautonia plasticadhaerens TaxID=2527974 RepID=A0A518H137_9BACT|nr:DinB family protein [Tautonia plasticadhaerens]QDV34547.1 Putative metal-dependent hydrolase YfiT [Tautonia plasticadhaerens]